MTDMRLAPRFTPSTIIAAVEDAERAVEATPLDRLVLARIRKHAYAESVGLNLPEIAGRIGLTHEEVAEVLRIEPENVARACWQALGEAFDTAHDDAGLPLHYHLQTKHIIPTLLTEYMIEDAPVNNAGLRREVYFLDHEGLGVIWSHIVPDAEPNTFAELVNNMLEAQRGAMQYCLYLLEDVAGQMEARADKAA